MKSVARNSIYNAIYQVLNMVFPLLASTYVARVLMPEGVGRVSYAQNIASYFLTAAALGLPTVGMRVISVARNNRNKLNRAFSELICINTISTTLALIGYLLLVFLLPNYRANCSLYIAAGLTVVFNYINIDWLYQGNEEYGYIVVRSLVTKILSLFALFIFVKDINDYVIYALISSLAIGGNHIFNVIQARKMVSFDITGLNIKRHLKPVLVIAASLFFSSIYSKVDTTMLGIMVGEASVGYYAYAHKILQVGVSACVAVSAAFMPRLSYYYENDMTKFRNLVIKGVRLLAFLAFPIAVGMYLYAPEAVQVLFGKDFIPAAYTLRWFSPMVLILSFGNLLCYQMLICSGNEKILVPIYAMASLLNVILNVILIPRLQHDGAAIASVCTELFINSVECVYAARKLKLRFDWKAIMQATLSAGIMAIVLMVLKPWGENPLISLATGVSVGAIVYFAINVMLHNQLLYELIKKIVHYVRRQK